MPFVIFETSNGTNALKTSRLLNFLVHTQHITLLVCQLPYMTFLRVPDTRSEHLWTQAICDVYYVQRLLCITEGLSDRVLNLCGNCIRPTP